MVNLYLRRRLGIKKSEAEILEPLAFKGVSEYLKGIDTSGLFEPVEPDRLDVKFRLEKPFVFGFFVKEVLDSPDVPDGLKDRVAEEAYNNIDFEFEVPDNIPAYLLSILQRILMIKEDGREYNSICRDAFDLIQIAFDLQPEVLTASDDAHVKDLFQRLVEVEGGLLDDMEKSLLLGIMLNLEWMSSDLAVSLLKAYLNCKRISTAEKRRMTSSIIDIRYSKRFWSDRLKRTDIIDRNTLVYREDILPHLKPVCLEWMGKHLPDKKKVISGYLRANPKHPASPSKYVAAIILAQAFRDELPEDYVREVIDTAIEFPNTEVKLYAFRIGYEIFGDEYRQKAFYHEDDRIKKWANTLR